MISKLRVIMIHTTLFSDGSIENKTFDNDEETFASFVTGLPEEAYFSKEGQYINEPDWNKVEEMQEQSKQKKEKGAKSIKPQLSIVTEEEANDGQ